MFAERMHGQLAGVLTSPLLIGNVASIDGQRTNWFSPFPPFPFSPYTFRPCRVGSWVSWKSPHECTRPNLDVLVMLPPWAQVRRLFTR